MQTADQREVRGFTWRQAVWLFVMAMTLEATIIGGFISIRTELSQNTKDNIKQDMRIDNVIVEMDRLKIHDATQDAQIDNLRQHHLDEAPVRYRQ